ncbi:MAG: aminotransferase class V-fold PLP-dependent enzyme [Chloroflexi bacterium]|nr:aminotransferase class V-fold PLP-dependent enzyme [Chloroflexota bacterium]
MIAANEDHHQLSGLPPGWPLEIAGQDERVPTLDGERRRYVNLDNAASTPPLLAVRDAVHRFANWYSSVHRGSGFKSQLSTHVLESAREAVADFVGADPDRHVVVFTRHTTEAINKMARDLADDPPIVFTTIMEHHANMLPWRVYASEVRFIHVDQDGCLDQEDLERQLRAAPTNRPRLVALAGAYNVTGYAPPLDQFARLAHRYGARIFVDGAQLVPHRRVRMRGSGEDDALDFLAFSAHKLYAPYGAGVLVAPRDAFSDTPDQLGGGIVDLVTLDRVIWAGIPEREEAGSPNVVGVVALAAAIRRLLELGMDNISHHEEALTEYALTQFAALAGVHVLGPRDVSRRVGVLSFTIDGVPDNLVAAALSYEWAIGLRAGCFCAHPGMSHLLQITPDESADIQRQIIAHVRYKVPGAVRASIGLHNSPADLEYLFSALRAILDGKLAGTYHLDPATGEYAPAGWQPDYDTYFHV